MDLNTSLIKLFEDNLPQIERLSCNMLNLKRLNAFEKFKQFGFPANDNEQYKYTDLQSFFGTNMAHSFAMPPKNINVPNEFRCNVDSMEVFTFFTVNGHLTPVQSNMPEGITVGSFAEIASLRPDLLESYFGKIATPDSDPFVALNTMLALDGFFIHIAKNIICEKPIQIINILTSDNNLIVNQRNMLILEEGAQAKILLCDHTLSPVKFTMNMVTEVQVGNRACLDFYNLQNQHNGTAQIGGYFFNQESQSVLNSNFITLQAGTARNNIYVRFSGTHAENYLSGLYLCDKRQHVDNFTFIDHAAADCSSNELFKGVLDDLSTAAFTGKIMVRPDAFHTNAYQANNNLLLTNKARINTRPWLEIYNDDVKCSHGATVGQLDEKAFFYMRQRGISREEANILLQYAFAYEVIEKIKMPVLKEQIRVLVEKRFRGKLDKCDSCGKFDNKALC